MLSDFGFRTLRKNNMLRPNPVAIGFFAAVQVMAIGTAPAHAAQNCGPNARWIQTGSLMGAGYCKPKGRRDHQVCAIGYHYEGRGVCARNGDWWQGRRPINWGARYQPQGPEGGVTFQGPNGGNIRVNW